MESQRMRDRWWGRTAFGIIALIFGLAFLLVPGFSVAFFLILFGFFLILTGLVLIGFSRQRPKGTAHRTLNLVEGVLNIIIGIVAILAPGFTAVLAVYIVGIFLIISGILQLGEGIIAPRGTATFGASNRWLLVISGIFSLVVGILIILYPGAGILAIVYLIGIFLIIIGIINIVSGFRSRKMVQPTTTTK